MENTTRTPHLDSRLERARSDASALARKIREVVDDPPRMARMWARNLEKAREYRYDVLSERRRGFYGQVKRATAAWLKGACV
jgi:L-malate glycosyltransferase